MKLTESKLRSIIRQELINEMMPKLVKDIGIGAALSTLISSPMLVRAYLQANPEMMKKVQDFLQTLLEE